MPKTTTQIKARAKTVRIETPVKKIEQKNSIWDIFKFGESYTSLILGIIVVIISTIILLTFVRGNNIAGKPSDNNQQNVAVKTEDNTKVSQTPAVSEAVKGNEQKNITTIPTKKVEQKNPTVAPTITKTVIAKNVEPTKKLEPTKKVEPTKKTEPTKLVAKETTNKQVSEKVAQVTNQTISGTTYTVAAGDTLWNIAEKKYNSGYNWVDIRDANKLTNSDKLAVGQKLALPNVKAKIATVVQTRNDNKIVSTVSQANKITGNDYTINKGDTLWDIAVRAYGDGYAWPKIASANKLSNPNLIHSGNKLSIPRA